MLAAAVSFSAVVARQKMLVLPKNSSAVFSDRRECDPMMTAGRVADSHAFCDARFSCREPHPFYRSHSGPANGGSKGTEVSASSQHFSRRPIEILCPTVPQFARTCREQDLTFCPCCRSRLICESVPLTQGLDLPSCSNRTRRCLAQLRRICGCSIRPEPRQALKVRLSAVCLRTTCGGIKVASRPNRCRRFLVFLQPVRYAMRPSRNRPDSTAIAPKLGVMIGEVIAEGKASSE
jgi:hypothetical protein